MKRLANIWNYHRWAIKLALLVIFVVSIVGLPQHLVKAYNEEQKRHPKDEREVRARIIDPMMFEIVKQVEQRVAQGQAYSPDEYFGDLKRYYKKCREFRIPTGSNAEIHRLQWLMQKALTEKKFSNWEVDQAAKAFRLFIDSRDDYREELGKSTRLIGFGAILHWFLMVYLKTLPLVFILYLVWAKDEADYKKFRLPKPLRFCILLGLYPFIIGYFICRALRESERRISAEAELRRSRHLFAYVTEEEQKKIEQFAKSNLSLAEWRASLSESGFTPRHSLAAAMMVTLLFVVVIRPAQASAKQVHDFGSNAVLEQIATSQNLARMSIELKKIQPEKSSCPWEGAGSEMAVESIDNKIYPRSSRLAQRTIFAPLTEFFRDIVHIPLQAVRFEANFKIQTSI